ncbi:uncharacterized protein LOC134507999 isoform X2 [Chroicocephalus ridibundus]|uniref:uncharacterized protein LOC134507999 isoform X2 n=1 Tax=Chroicocephalus ridibundus TaxID=1192867 RepID=UPI002FDDCE71
MSPRGTGCHPEGPGRAGEFNFLLPDPQRAAAHGAPDPRRVATDPQQAAPDPRQEATNSAPNPRQAARDPRCPRPTAGLPMVPLTHGKWPLTHGKWPPMVPLTHGKWPLTHGKWPLRLPLTHSKQPPTHSKQPPTHSKWPLTHGDSDPQLDCQRCPQPTASGP